MDLPLRIVIFIHILLIKLVVHFDDSRIFPIDSIKDFNVFASDHLMNPHTVQVSKISLNNVHFGNNKSNDSYHII